MPRTATHRRTSYDSLTSPPKGIPHPLRPRKTRSRSPCTNPAAVSALARFPSARSRVWPPTRCDEVGREGGRGVSAKCEKVGGRLVRIRIACEDQECLRRESQQRGRSTVCASRFSRHARRLLLNANQTARVLCVGKRVARKPQQKDKAVARWGETCTGGKKSAVVPCIVNVFLHFCLVPAVRQSTKNTQRRVIRGHAARVAFCNPPAATTQLPAAGAR